MGARNYPGRNAKIHLGKPKTCLSDQVQRVDPRFETAAAGLCGVTRGQGFARSGEGNAVALAPRLSGQPGILSGFPVLRYSTRRCPLSTSEPDWHYMPLLQRSCSHDQLVVLYRRHPDISPKISRIPAPGGLPTEAVVKTAIE